MVSILVLEKTILQRLVKLPVPQIGDGDAVRFVIFFKSALEPRRLNGLLTRVWQEPDVTQDSRQESGSARA
jgi:hypothetical protein